MASSARLLCAALVWRRAALPTAGRALARAVCDEAGGDDDEQARTIAGMGLVQAGPRSVGVIEAEVAARGASTTAVCVLADIGGAEAGRVLAGIAAGQGDAADLARRLLDGP